jgi:hypothetical protein
MRTETGLVFVVFSFHIVHLMTVNDYIFIVLGFSLTFFRFRG